MKHIKIHFFFWFFKDNYKRKETKALKKIFALLKNNFCDFHSFCEFIFFHYVTQTLLELLLTRININDFPHRNSFLESRCYVGEIKVERSESRGLLKMLVKIFFEPSPSTEIPHNNTSQLTRVFIYY